MYLYFRFFCVYFFIYFYVPYVVCMLPAIYELTLLIVQTLNNTCEFRQNLFHLMLLLVVRTFKCVCVCVYYISYLISIFHLCFVFIAHLLQI